MNCLAGSGIVGCVFVILPQFPLICRDALVCSSWSVLNSIWGIYAPSILAGSSRFSVPFRQKLRSAQGHQLRHHISCATSSLSSHCTFAYFEDLPVTLSCLVYVGETLGPRQHSSVTATTVVLLANVFTSICICCRNHFKCP